MACCPMLRACCASGCDLKHPCSFVTLAPALKTQPAKFSLMSSTMPKNLACRLLLASLLLAAWHADASIDFVCESLSPEQCKSLAPSRCSVCKRVDGLELCFEPPVAAMLSRCESTRRWRALQMVA
jgi:hypothetical protein